MTLSEQALPSLADHLASRRGALMSAWRAAIEADSTLTTGYTLPRAQLDDHIPALLESFETQLRVACADPAHRGDAAAHGLHRWQQGFGLAEVSRELGHLNACMVSEIDACAALIPPPAPESLSHARQLWANLFGWAVSASTAQYFRLQQIEAAGYVEELEAALRNLRILEQQRAALWQQAAHDLRGNLGVVANVAAGLGYPNLDGLRRDNFMRMLARNMDALHKLLDDFTCLARLQGGQEVRRLDTVDVAALVTEMGQDMSYFADSQGLSLELIGAPEFSVESDAAKLRRIVQNLVLNAIRYTVAGGVTVSWGPAGHDDPERWVLEVRDTGPGLASRPETEVIDALQTATGQAREMSEAAGLGEVSHVRAVNAGLAEPVPPPEQHPGASTAPGAGEGIGLSIVKRLCELLDATLQVESGQGGTCFRILIPNRYPSEPSTVGNERGASRVGADHRLAQPGH